MKNIVKQLITSSCPAVLAASMAAPVATADRDIKLCDITGSHLVSAQPPRAVPAPLPPPPPFPQQFEFITGIRQ